MTVLTPFMPVLGIVIGVVVGYVILYRKKKKSNKKAGKLHNNNKLFHTLKSEGDDRPKTGEETPKDVAKQPASPDYTEGSEDNVLSLIERY